MSKERKTAANKGFSLVELIIVIAIMAILGVVLAPQFTKYVERSRVSTDKQNVAAIVNALQVYYIDPANTTIIEDNTTIEITTTATDVTSENCKGNTDVALKDAGITKIGLKSTSWGTVTLTVNTDGGVLTVSSNPTTILE